MLDKLAPASISEYILLFLLCSVSFFVGWFFARASISKLREKVKAYEKEKQPSFLTENAFKADSENVTHAPNGIKAIQTRGRSGAVVGQEDIEEEKLAQAFDLTLLEDLDFDRLGRGDAESKDDLKLITGVGPFVEDKLNSIGIFTFEQISRFTDEDIKKVTELTEFFPGRIERDDWVSQAKKLKR